MEGRGASVCDNHNFPHTEMNPALIAEGIPGCMNVSRTRKVLFYVSRTQYSRYTGKLRIRHIVRERYYHGTKYLSYIRSTASVSAIKDKFTIMKWKCLPSHTAIFHASENFEQSWNVGIQVFDVFVVRHVASYVYQNSRTASIILRWSRNSPEVFWNEIWKRIPLNRLLSITKSRVKLLFNNLCN